MFEEKMNMEEGLFTASQKSHMGGSGSPERASPAAIERYLKGIGFPAGKRDLISKAKSNSAPSDVMNALNQFSDKEYNSVIDISKEVGRIE